MRQAAMQQRASMVSNTAIARPVPLAWLARAPVGPRLAHTRRRQRPATTQSRFINIQIAASWGNGQGSSSGPTGGGSGGGEAYADSEPRWGGFLNSNSSSSSSGGQEGSPVTRLLSAAVDHVRAAPLPGAAAPWLVLPLLPVVVWCVGWVFTTGMFTLAQTSMSAMCSLAKLLYPTISLRGASYEDIAVSLVKALASGTDQPSTWMRPGLLAPAWLLRWLMGTLYGLATAGTSIAGSLMHNPQLLTVTGVSKALLYASCLLFMLPLGSGLSSLAATLKQRLGQAPGSSSSSGSGSSSGGGYGSSGSAAGYGGSGTSGGGSAASGGSGLGAAAAAGGGSGGPAGVFGLPKLSDTSALALKLAGVLAWPCISAAAVLQPSLLLQANSATGPLGVSGPQVALCCCLLSLLLTLAAAAGRFGWELCRRQADADTVVDFGLQLGVLCGLAGVLNVVQLGLSVAGGQLDPQQLGMPLLSTLILGRIVFSTWRLWKMEAYAPSVWLQVLTLTPALSSSSSGGGGGGSSGGSTSGGSSGGGDGSSSSYRP